MHKLLGHAAIATLIIHDPPEIELPKVLLRDGTKGHGDLPACRVRRYTHQLWQYGYARTAWEPFCEELHAREEAARELGLRRVFAAFDRRGDVPPIFAREVYGDVAGSNRAGVRFGVIQDGVDGALGVGGCEPVPAPLCVCVCVHVCMYVRVWRGR